MNINWRGFICRNQHQTDFLIRLAMNITLNRRQYPTNIYLWDRYYISHDFIIIWSNNASHYQLLFWLHKDNTAMMNKKWCSKIENCIINLFYKHSLCYIKKTIAYVLLCLSMCSLMCYLGVYFHSYKVMMEEINNKISPMSAQTNHLNGTQIFSYMIVP